MIQLRQVFYVSRATGSLGDAEVRSILRVSQRNNRKLDLTGCLMFTGQHFGQTLEGDADAVESLLVRIGQDPRQFVAAELVGAEQVGPAGPAQRDQQVHVVRSWQREERGQQ